MIKSSLKSGILFCLACLLSLLCCEVVVAAEPVKPVAQSAAVVETGESAEAAIVAAPVVVLNRTVTVFRSPYFGVAPADRAVRAKQETLRVLDKGGAGKVTFQSTPQGGLSFSMVSLSSPFFQKMWISSAGKPLIRLHRMQ